MSTLTILWTALLRTDVAALEEAVREYDASLVHTPAASLRLRAIPALAVGPVIAIATNDKEASAALGVGVDEVLRAGEVTHDALKAAVDRAIARASARTQRINGVRSEDDDEVAFALLSVALGKELSEPLNRASEDCERLKHGLSNVLEVSDDFVSWSGGTETLSSGDHEELRRITARRLAAPSSRELRATVQRLSAAVLQARSTVGALRDLTRGAQSPLSAKELLEDIVEVLRVDMDAVTELTLEVEGRCQTIVPRATFVFVVVSLIAHALDSIRSAGRAERRLSVRGFEAEGAVVVEFADNGIEIPADLRPDLMEPLFRDPDITRGGLPGIRDRVRRAGGELVVDTDTTGSTVRVILPTAANEEFPIAALAIAPRGKVRPEA
jgi:signal transduction histidine kinase